MLFYREFIKCLVFWVKSLFYVSILRTYSNFFVILTYGWTDTTNSLFSQVKMEMWNTLRNFPLDLFIDSLVGSYCFCDQPRGANCSCSRPPSPFPMYRLKNLAPTLANHTRRPSRCKRFPRSEHTALVFFSSTCLLSLAFTLSIRSLKTFSWKPVSW